MNLLDKPYLGSLKSKGFAWKILFLASLSPCAEVLFILVRYPGCCGSFFFFYYLPSGIPGGIMLSKMPAWRSVWVHEDNAMREDMFKNICRHQVLLHLVSLVPVSLEVRVYLLLSFLFKLYHRCEEPFCHFARLIFTWYAQAVVSQFISRLYHW